MREPVLSWRPRQLVAAFVALAIFAVSCSSDGPSENVVPLDASAPGVIYVSTSDGDLQVVKPSSSEASLVLSPGTSEDRPLVDVARAPLSGGVQALAQVPGESLVMSFFDVTKSGLEELDGLEGANACLDPHANAAVAIAHKVVGGGAGGPEFEAITWPDGSLTGNFELTSVVCPLWSSTRDSVATASTTSVNDPSSIVTLVQDAAGNRHEIGFDLCGTTPTSFSPNDEFLTLAVTCYRDLWSNSGLYLVSVDELANIGDLSALTKLGDGLYGRASWHPDGDWLVTTHADAIAKQNIAVDLRSQPIGMRVIEVDTRQTLDLGLADGATPFSFAWIESEIS